MKRTETYITKGFYAALFIALCIKFMLYGFSYFPVLDDYIQYGCYPLYKNPSHVFLYIGTLKTRPLTAVLDEFLWGRLWNYQWLSLIIISLLLCGLACLLHKTLKLNKITVSPLFYVILLLCPLNSEATYWLSASSRIVVGLFFAALSAWCLTLYLNRKKKVYLIFFLFANLASYGFYEPVTAVSFALSVFIIILNGKKAFVLTLIPVINGIIILLYYYFMRNIGNLAARTVFQADMLGGNIASALSQLGEVLHDVLPKMLTIGFYDGLNLLFASAAGICIFTSAFIVSISLALLIRHKKLNACLNELLLGIVIFAFAIIPCVLTENVWITLRTAFLPFVGIALIFDCLFCFAIRNKTAVSVITGILTLVFIISSVNEYDTYKRTCENDSSLLNKVISQLDDNSDTYYIYAPSEPDTAQAAFYKDHVKTVFSSDWAVTGAVRAVSKDLYIKNIQIINSSDKYLEKNNSKLIYLN